MKRLLLVVGCVVLTGAAPAQNLDRPGSRQGINDKTLITTSAPAGMFVDGPLTPEQSLKAFQIEDGMRMEVVVAEPLVIDPVALCFDVEGAMYVAENRGYPTGPGEGKEPVGAIARLTDKDGDGFFESRTEFASGLTFPNGLLPWKGGVYVTCSPDIYYLKDTDGDGKADVRQVVLTGFSTKSTTQLRVAHPKLGLDGWIWITAGLQGGEVTSPLFPDREAVTFKKSDSRFRPGSYEFETVSGQAQFGLSFDDYGNKFICSNRHPIWHAVAQSDHWKRNPKLAFSETVQVVGKAGDEAVVFPLSRDTTTAGFHPRLLSTPHAGTFTSACGTLIFRGDALGRNVAGSAFICEPAQNLVQRQVLTPKGATFDAKLATQGHDFLATPDSWSRIVYADAGPDGALYLCDFYRKTLDHPQYLPEEVRGTADFVSGTDMGRIYRVVAEDWKPSKPVKLAGAKPARLVAALDHRNGWVRDAAFRLLIEQQPESVVGRLRKVLAGNSNEKARVNAFWLLESMGKMDRDQLVAVMKDAHPRVREQAVKLAEKRVGEDATLIGPLLGRADDPDGKVRFHAALALAVRGGERSVPALAKIALRGSGDRWSRAAALSGVADDPAGFARQILARLDLAGSDPGELMQEVGRLLGASLEPGELVPLINEITQAAKAGARGWQAAAVAGIADGLRSQRKNLEGLLKADQAGVKEARERVDAIMKRAAEFVGSASVAQAERMAAIELLGHASAKLAAQPLLALVGSSEPDEIQQAAIRALARHAKEGVGAELVEAHRWRKYPPGISRAVVTTMLSQTGLTKDLLEAIEQGVVQTWMIEPRRRASLMKHRDKEIKALANKVFGDLESGDRMKAYEASKEALKLEGVADNGKAIFLRACAQCHQYRGAGFQVGPDLAGVRNQPAEALLLHIVVPNYEVYPGFTSYEVETTDDRVLSGLLLSETDTSITIRQAQGIEETVLRSNLASIRSTSLSLMPQEVEKTMTQQEMADLIAFLKSE